MKLTIFCDASCEPVNPGGYACCAFIVFEGDVSGAEGAVRPPPIHYQYACIGHGPGMTNNVGEYRAVKAALNWLAKKYPLATVDVYTDSQLVVKQVSGQWGCKAEHLAPFRDECRKLLKRLPNTTLTWIPRELNDVADALTHQAYREAISA